MKRRIFILLCLILCLTLPACRTESDEVWEALMGKPKPPSTPAPVNSEAGKDGNAAEDGLQGTLTISQFRTSPGDAVSALAMEFSAQHPGVKFDFEWFVDGWNIVGMTDAQIAKLQETYQSKMRMKLITGEAADIIVNTDGLKLYGISHSGVLRDLLPFWERDMDPNSYFTRVTDLGIIDGKMVAVPQGFRTYMVYVNRRVSEGLGLDLAGRNAIGAEEMLDWYRQALAQGLLPPDAPMLFNQGPDMPNLLFDVEKTRYLDWETHVGSFDSPACQGFLQSLQAIPFEIVDQDNSYLWTSSPAVINELIRCRATGAKTQLTNDPDGWSFAMHLDYVQKTREALFDLEYLNDITLRDAAECPCDYLEGPFLLTNSSGQAPVSFWNELAVTSGCSDPELAWEFVKFCVSDRESTTLLNGYSYINGKGIAVNRQIQRQMAQETRLRWSGADEYNNLQWYWADDVAPDAAEAALDRLLSEPLINAKLYNMEDVNGCLDEFLIHKLTTAEQCAKKMQDQAYIWLTE